MLADVLPFMPREGCTVQGFGVSEFTVWGLAFAGPVCSKLVDGVLGQTLSLTLNIVHLHTHSTLNPEPSIE